jgi:3-phosphoshikimate 1-carboxyvinyltransferase
MGADIVGDTPPLTIRGSKTLHGIDYSSPVASAQIKSCLLLAGLNAVGTTSITEPHLSRDHTERMFEASGIRLQRDGLKVSVEGGQRPNGFEFSIPADISSAAFFMVAAAILPESNLLLHDVGINPTRSGILDVFKQAGLSATILDESESLGEPMAAIQVCGGTVGSAFSIEGDLVPRLVDEIPVLAILATQLDGVSRIRDAKELRVKESDRIEAMTVGLRAMGANVEVFEDGMDISGPTRLKGTRIEANYDHRIAMAFAIAGLIAEGETTISGEETIATSYPDFERDLWSVCVV